MMGANLANPNIKHIFVLMLENRSFDHMLGWSGLKGKDASTGEDTQIVGVSAANTNAYEGTTYPATRSADFVMPFDPGHEFPDVAEQLCGQPGAAYKGGAYPAIDNSGFVSNYATTKSAGEGGATTNFGEIMKGYDPTQLPVMTALASSFAVCDHWFSSLPGPTWPNRFFVHAASSGGLDHSPRLIETTEWETIKGFAFEHGTLYDLMNTSQQQWRLYRGAALPLIGSIPSVAGLKGVKLSDTHSYDNFATDINGEYPYQYTFIEPNYGDIVNNSYSGGTSQHPMDDVRHGEALIKSTYEAIRNSPLWLNSLLIINYDEHGGFYDHFAPPVAVAPGDTLPHSKYNTSGFDFTRLGVRVPALVVSAYTAQSWISHETYDHSSVPATVEAILGLGALTQRDGAAKNVTGLASLGVARTDCPVSLPAVGGAPATAGVTGEAGVTANAVTSEAAVAPAATAMIDETKTPIDGGNLPAFLHVVMKAEMEKQTEPGPRSLLLDGYTGQLKTKADARVYLTARLPGLLE